ncbi:MAG: preprotein translocase subunit SecG [Xylanivirga thermophila]|uniref:preprotein translocase subunit SecG n=1 Tax=Xylanivirga thermophila TaxID=2496273 RepID=UPI00101D0D9F|nr:preprotein translocase subunit SecG [Xylanivirga thermophila]
MAALKIILTVLLVIAEVFLIVIVLLQPGKTAGISGSIAGGAETFFGKNKARSYEGKLQRWTKISAGAFIALNIILVLVNKLA